MRSRFPHRLSAALRAIPLALTLTLAARGGGGGSEGGSGPHTISGTAAHAPGVQVTLTGGAGGPTVATADAEGRFTFTDVADGTYEVTPDPARPFQPTQADVVVAGRNVQVDFALDLSRSVVLYATAAQTDGAIGGRTGADALCAAELPAGTSCGHVHAVLSVSEDDSIATMPARWGLPTNRPIRRPTGVLIDTDWPAMFVDGSAEAVTGTDTTYWTGSNQQGEVVSSCDGWTSTTYAAFVGFGEQAGVNPQYTWTWLSGTAPVCTARFSVLCGCW